MPKYKFYTDEFPSSIPKCLQATYFEEKLEMMVKVLKILHKHSDETCDPSWRNLQDIVQNIEHLFDFRVPDINPSVSSPNNGPSSQIWSRPIKEESSSYSLKKMVPFVDGAKDGLQILETYTILYQKSVEFGGTAAIPNNPKADKMDIDATEDGKVKTNLIYNMASLESKEDLKVMLLKNLVQLRSVSIMKQDQFIEIEVDIDFSCMSDENLQKNHRQETSASKTDTSSRKSEQIISASGSSSKRSTDGSVATDRHVSVDNSDSLNFPSKRFKRSNVFQSNLNFQTKRLLSILKNRRSCLEQIKIFFKNFMEDASSFKEAMKHFTFFADNLPKNKEPYLTVDLLKLRGDLSEKTSETEEIAKSWFKETNNVQCILMKYEMEINRFDEAYVPCLEDASKLSDSSLMIIESHLKDFCTKANEMMFIKNNRRMILINTLPKFELFLNHFIKCLIIMGILK